MVGEGGGESGAEISFSIVNVIKLLGVGIIAAATMVIPGVSGSMIMMILGYYNTIIDTINDFINALKDFDIGGDASDVCRAGAVWHRCGGRRCRGGKAH